MKERYKIQASFKENVKNRQYGQSIGHSFWQLVKELHHPNGLPQIIVEETFYAFPISKEVENSASTKSRSINTTFSILWLPKKWRIYCFEGTFSDIHTLCVEPDSTHVVYGSEPKQTDAKSRWEDAKNNLPKNLNIIAGNPKSIVFDDIIRNNVYAALATIMGVEPYQFEKFLSLQASTTSTSEGYLSLHQAPTPLVRYKIKAAVVHTAVNIGQWKVHSFPIRVGHHFWILVKTCYGQETMVDSIHGLSTRFRTDHYGSLHPRIPRCVGTWNSRLKVYSIPHPSTQKNTTNNFLMPDWIDPDETYTKYGDEPSEQYALARWNRAKSLLGKLNDTETPYSFCGFGKSIGFFKCKNSNSAFSTAAVLFGFTPHKFEKYFSPGSKTIMISKEAIANLTTNNIVREESNSQLTY